MMSVLKIIPRVAIRVLPRATFVRSNSTVATSSFSSKYSKKDGNIEKPEKVSKLVSTLSEEWKEKLVGDAKVSQIKLEKLTGNIFYLENKSFPIPETLTFEQWKRLLSLETTEALNLYLESIRNGLENDPETVKKIEEVNKYATMPLTVKDPDVLKKLIGNDESLQAHWYLIEQTYESMKSYGLLVHPILTEKDVKLLLHAKKTSAIEHTLLFIGTLYQKRVSNYVAKKGKRAEKDAQYANKSAELEKDDGHIKYGCFLNCIMLRIQKHAWEQMGMYNAMRESTAPWKQNLVIDLTWNSKMKPQAIKSLGRELSYAVNINRQAPEPFHIHFTGVTKEVCSQFEKTVASPGLFHNEHAEDVTDQSYLDLFPSNRIVYLSPDSKNELIYNPDDVYIIGGLVDTTAAPRASLGKAKTDRIRHAHLPLRKHIGRKAILNVETVVAIMCDYRRTRDWFYSFRWVPARFIRAHLLHSQHGYTLREKATYEAHHQLMPTDPFDNNYLLSPLEYRKKYRDIILRVEDDGVRHDPEPLKFQNPHNLKNQLKEYHLNVNTTF